MIYPKHCSILISSNRQKEEGIYIPISNRRLPGHYKRTSRRLLQCGRKREILWGTGQGWVHDVHKHPHAYVHTCIRAHMHTCTHAYTPRCPRVRGACSTVQTADPTSILSHSETKPRPWGQIRWITGEAAWYHWENWMQMLKNYVQVISYRIWFIH